MPPKQKSTEESAVEVKKTIPGIKKCAICNFGRVQGDNELTNFGGYWKLNKDLYFHYFCLLFSKNAKQRGKSDEGVRGFLPKDINWVLQEYKKHKCTYCKKNMATSICEFKNCNKRFHYTCGMQHGGKVQFHKSRAFCSDESHWPKSNYKVKHDTTCLAGCHDEVVKNEQSIVSPCCQRINHFECVQNMALSYGKVHLKCPYCNDKKKFCDEAQNQGIYIPEKDAAWENPDEESFYNFQAMGQLYSVCDAKPCACTKGPKFNLAGSRFEIIRCDHCGSSAVHIYCGRLMKKAPFFICENHENNEGEMEQRNKLARIKLKEENINEDDEDDWIDDSHLVDPRFEFGAKRKSTSPHRGQSSSGSGLGIEIKKPKLLVRTPKKHECASNDDSTNSSPLSSASSASTPSPRKTKNSRDISPSCSSSPSKKIKNSRAKITEEILIDTESEDEEEPSTAAINNDIKTGRGSKIVQTPFRLFNPKTQESFVMKVAPLPFFELSPSLEGLNLQVHETLQKYHQSQTPVKSPKPEEKVQLPIIGAPFSLAPLGKSSDVIDLCDSD